MHRCISVEVRSSCIFNFAFSISSSSPMMCRVINIEHRCTINSWMMCYQYAFHGYHKMLCTITKCHHKTHSSHLCIRTEWSLWHYVMHPFPKIWWNSHNSLSAGTIPLPATCWKNPDSNWRIIDAFGRLASISKQNPIKINRERSSWSNTELFINNRQNTEYFHNSFIQLAEILSFQLFSLIFRHRIGLSALMCRFWPCS